MLALQAVWSCSDGLILWAEDVLMLSSIAHQVRGAGTGASGRRLERPRPARATVRGHPYAATADHLLDALAGAVSDGAEANAVESAVLLPSAPSRPFASSTAKRLVREPRSWAQPKLRPWAVPALAFPESSALDALLGLVDLESPATVLGDSVRFLIQAAELSLNLVVRGRVLPALLLPEIGAPEARWLAAPTPGDVAAATRLAAAMPPLLRTQATEPDTGKLVSPHTLLSDILGSLVDVAARQAASSVRILPPRRGRKPRTVPALEAFLTALTGDDAVVPGDVEELSKLARTLEEWRRSGLAPSGTLRTCFRLTPPGGEPAEDGVGQGSWRLEFLLQSMSDPSLLIPAGEVWRGGPILSSVDLGGENPTERLLGDLGQASRLLPELDAGLQLAHPEVIELDTQGAYRFLSEGALLLEQAGFGVLLPPWWRADASRLGLKLQVGTLGDDDFDDDASSGLLGVDGLCDYRYQVALGDDVLSAKQLGELARLKAPLVQVKGRWVELRPEDLQAALEILRRQRSGDNPPLAAADVLRVGLGLNTGTVELPVTAVEADGWLGELLSGDHEGRVQPMSTPASFEGALRPYQERGLAWLWFLDRLRLGACLADDMGLGKTPQLLALLLAERDGSKPGPRRRVKPTLLVCPMSVVGNWQREADRFAPSLAVHVHHGAERESGKAFARTAKRADLVITTYALLARDHDLLERVEWGRLVLDEAQNIKNPDAKAAKAARSLRTTRRVALTGTPVENRLSELWSIMEFLNPGLLGKRDTFRSRFAVPIERYRDEGAARVLQQATGPFILRRLKTDRSIISDLPDKVEMKVFCNLTREQATLYQAVVDDMLRRLKKATGIQRKGIILSTMTKLKQVCNHPAHLLGDGSRVAGRSGKLARLEEILEEAINGGDRTLCFTQFTEMGQLLHDHLRERLGYEIPFLHGGVPKRQRDEIVESFQRGEGAPVLLLSLKAGGVGLNLTGANQVVHYDRWWNPAVEDQATDRAFRIGQRKDVQVRKFVCVGTLEERIDRLIEQKRDLAERIVGSGEAWVTELSTEQIRDLVALSADAVAEG